MPWLSWTLSVAVAGDIWMKENSDGSITFTDMPGDETWEAFEVDGPPPPPARVNLQTFPLLDSFDPLFVSAELRYGVDAELLKAVCVAESGMNPNAVSHAGAQGLMQLMPATAQDLAVTDPFDPEQSIGGGARYLAWQLATFGSVHLALAAYNAGPANVKKFGRIPPFDETQDYVPKVMALYDLFRYERPITGHE